jgi:hypothetical protein
MFAMMGLIMRGENEIEYFPKDAYGIADAMLEARKKEVIEEGIVAVKPKRRTK